MRFKIPSGIYSARHASAGVVVAGMLNLINQTRRPGPGFALYFRSRIPYNAFCLREPLAMVLFVPGAQPVV
ncbi:MAG: hypothetical protein KJ970_13455 [Candidatus Eisenbacteria bacterium]|uniref:Uncharacterized protein n=1 Tax=Eiseniibacteriota bacterium TaxID=2212470 RepID=A0A948RXS5_UNCEI|nr:hypothetical protein [Candidatus Eisenbacteria bacterium]MBU1949874.1 hypothetical protein [Candidatus Eisenbacteria bacterium]MBU2691921.1 hypothetical protein [Candidatus Eisenbacteria bacterium]